MNIVQRIFLAHLEKCNHFLIVQPEIISTRAKVSDLSIWEFSSQGLHISKSSLNRNKGTL
jgi:hypothetical protein